MEHKKDVVTVVREDGKEFVIQRKVLAEHINRGFQVKDEKDQPSEDELKAAVGYKEGQRKDAPAERGAVVGRKEPSEEAVNISKEKPAVKKAA